MQFSHTPAKLCYHLCLFFMLGMLAACSSSKRIERVERPAPARTAPPQETVTPKPAEVVYDESFDPATLREPAFDIPHKMPKDQVQSQAFVQVQTDTTARDTSWVTTPGYQLQLLQTEDGQQAREAMKIALFDLDTDVQVVYDPPYYKVRAGRFVNRYDAERLQKLADEKGYTYAWVVRTAVRVRAYELNNQNPK